MPLYEIGRTTTRRERLSNRLCDFALHYPGLFVVSAFSAYIGTVAAIVTLLVLFTPAAHQ